MKRIFALLLCLFSILTLAACAASPTDTTLPATEPTETEPTEPIDTYNYPEIKDKLTWEKINSYPLKTSDMTEQEMRKMCVEFFRFTKSALWTPNADFKYIRNSKGTADEILKGTVYGSLPYIGLGSGSIYRLMDYLNEETGVLDIKRAAKVSTLFGNQCANGAYVAWGRVINSVTGTISTSNMVVGNGYIRIGSYTYDDNKSRFTEEDNTVSVCKANGEQVLFQSYALMQPADGFVQYTTAGHVMMCASVPHVEYIEGTDQIDGEKSYLYIIDQHQGWKETTNDSGDTYLYKNYVDRKMTFQKLFEGSYLPFTFAEFLGTDPVEDTECTFSFTGDTITVKELFAGKVSSNYCISDIYAIVKNAEGKEVYRHAVRAKNTGNRDLALVRNSDNIDKWGTLDVSSGEFTVEVVAQLLTGERPTVYTGKLVP